MSVLEMRKAMNEVTKQSSFANNCPTSFGGNVAMAGLAMFDQKNVIAVTIIIVTAFKICVSHRKNGLVNRPCAQVSFSTF
jgi:hypothetical protein